MPSNLDVDRKEVTEVTDLKLPQSPIDLLLF